MSKDMMIRNLFEQVAAGKMSRRSALQHAAALGASAAAFGVVGRSAMAQDASPEASAVVESYEP